MTKDLKKLEGWMWNVLAWETTTRSGNERLQFETKQV